MPCHAMVWLLDVRKAKGLDSKAAHKHLHKSVRVVLQDVTRLLACGVRMVETKGTQVGEKELAVGICSYAPHLAE